MRRYTVTVHATVDDFTYVWVIAASSGRAEEKALASYHKNYDYPVIGITIEEQPKEPQCTQRKSSTC